MNLTFADPLWLIALALVAPVVWTALRWRHAMSTARAWTCAAARSVLVALVVLILAGAASVRETDRMAVLVVVDVSDSVRQFADRFGSYGVDERGQDRAWSDAILDYIRTLDEERDTDDLLGVVAFDGGQVAVSTVRSGPLAGASLDFRAGGGTDIGGALRFSEALFPPDARRRIVLVSDGNDTTGGLSRQLDRLATHATSVDVVPLTYRVTGEVLVEGVDAPPRAAAGSTVVVRVLLNATQATTGRLDLLYNDRRQDLNGAAPGSSRAVTLREGTNVIPVTVDLTDDRLHRFEPIFTPNDPDDDGLVANNRAEAFTVTPGRGVVGVVSERARSETPILVTTLRGAGIEAVALTPGELPSTLLGLHRFDLLVLDNVSRPEIPEPIQRNIAEYVRTLGGGLVMTGGDASFGAGAWNNSPIAEILPVSLDLPEEIRTPSAAIAFVIDRSGSMGAPVMGGSRTQQEIANESTALAISTLDPSDLVTVVTFSGSTRVDIPLARNTDPSSSAGVVRTIGSSGGTDMYPAIRLAGESLMGAEANVKHVIVLSDGLTMGRDPTTDLELGRYLSDNGVTVSTIGIGDTDAAASESLRLIAQAGGGTYHPVIDPNALPRIFLKEVMVARTPSIRLGPFQPEFIASGSPLTTGLSTDAPPLRGVNITQPKDDPLITYALATERAEPLLAHWFVGQGQVAAFTSGAGAPWAKDWVSPLWRGYAGLWTRIARTISRPAGGSGYELTTDMVGDDLLIRLDAFDLEGDPVDLLSVPGTVYTPDGRAVDVRLAQVGPGAYEARIPATERGSYAVALTPTRAGRAQAAVIGGATRSVGPELANLTSDSATMRRIADRTGGRRLSLDDPDARMVFDRAGLEPTRASTPLWPVLAAWAIAIFALDVGTRRIAWDRLLSREVVDSVREQTSGAVKARSQRAAGVLGGLRAVAKKAERAPKQEQERPRAPLRHRPMAPASETPKDAEGLAKAKREAQERDERRKEMRARLLEEMATGKKKASPNKARPKPDADKKEDGDTTSGLLAAKKRARERYRPDDE